jgi:DNA-binding response OmpR family regulator
LIFFCGKLKLGNMENSPRTILVIDDSSVFRNFLEDQLTAYNFQVLQGINGLDGFNKMRSELPDLVIMDYYLSRKSSTDILQYKKENPNIKNIPVIMTIGNVARDKVLEVARFGVRKILYKPVKIDTLLRGISEILQTNIAIDETPCLLDAHLNDKILFIEIAKGFNIQKIQLLKYKIAELVKLYEVSNPKILIMMTDIQFKENDAAKVDTLLETAHSFLKHPNDARVMSTSTEIREYLEKRTRYKIPLADDLTSAMDGLFGIKGLESLTAEQDHVQESFFSSKKELRDNESFQLNFEVESGLDLSSLGGNLKIAVVDDDFVVQTIVETSFKATGWTIDKYGNGAEFLNALQDHKYDLLFLDLMMPGINGFAVLQYLSTNRSEMPVIVLSAMTRKESVQRAMDFGIKTYMIKPVKPEGIIKKTVEVLRMNY